MKSIIVYVTNRFPGCAVAGCKIKALRAKTNTYIKTPVRGEEPVFVVTGRKEDVGAAKREILSAAEHFSQIRASRRNNNTNGSAGSLAPGPPSPNAPGQVTIQVRVPYRVVGLVVGPKGATIKRIQQQTRTYIVTPSRDKEPVFEVTGTPENVEKARQEIESHIALRTGGMVEANNGLGGGSVPPTPGPHTPADDNDFHNNGVESGFHDLSNDMMGTMYKPPSSNSAFTSYNSALNTSNNLLSHAHHGNHHNRTQHADSHTPNIFNFPTIAPNANTNGSAKISDYAPSMTNGFTNGFGLYDNDEGIASPSFDAPHMSVWQDMGSGDHCKMGNGSQILFNPPHSSVGVTSGSCHPRRSSSISSSTTPRLSPTLTDSSSNAPVGSPGSGAVTPGSDHSTVRRIRSDPLSGGLSAMTFAPLSNGVLGSNPGSAFTITTSSASLSSSNNSTSSSPTDSTGSANANRRRHCLMCNDGGVVAALVPCGHNLFCMDCANLIVDKPETDRRCPVCQQTPTQAIRIFS